MGWFDSFFGDKKTQSTNTTQSGTSSFGLTPAVQDYWKSISGMFGPNTWNPVGPNQYQTQAAGTQAGLGSSLMPAYGAAGNIASGGINEGDISRFMNPYTQNVIDTTLGTMRRSDAIANAGSQGQAAKLGALSGTNPIVARNLNEDAQARARNSTMAQLQNQNYAQAAEMAKASTNAQLSGIGAMNSTVGNMAGINQGLFGMGSQFYNQAFQNQMMPYQLAQMGTQTLAGLSPFSGASSTGNSSGTSTTTGTSSPFSVLGNLIGLGFAGGWQPFGKADGGRVGKAEGGSVGGDAASSHERFVKAFDTISGLMSRSKGGSVMQPYADGGAIGSWDTTVTPAPSFDYRAMGDRLQKMGQPAPMGNDDGGLAAAQSSLSSFMSSMQRPRYDNGGAVEWGEAGPAFPVSGLEPPSFLGAAPDTVTRSALPPPRYVEPELSRITSPGGAAFSVAKPHADRFSAFLSDLEASGYPIKGDQSGGFNPRTIAGTNKLSNHAHGAAIDVNWGENPRGGAGAIPAEIARSLAQKHGLVWGGDWKNPDPMHFEIAGQRPQQAPASSGEVMLASGRGTVPTSAAPERDSWLTRMLPGLKEGIWAGKPATPEQRFGTALMNIRGPMFEGPLNGVARNVMEWEQGRQRERQIDNEVNRLMGQVGGQPTMEARRLALEEAKNPEEIKRIQAMTKAAELQSDKAYQLEVARATAEMQKEVARADLEQRAGLVEKLFPSNQPPAAGSSTRMRWVPTPPQQTPMPAPAAGAPPPPPQTAPVQSAPQQSSEPPPDSPAARSAIRRSEASDKLRSRQSERKTEQAAVQMQFNADAASLQPMEFVRKYSDRRGDLTVDQIRKLDAMIDRLSRGTP